MCGPLWRLDGVHEGAPHEGEICRAYRHRSLHAFMSGEGEPHELASVDEDGERARELEQRDLDLAAKPRARLAWLEDAIRLAHASGALPRLR